MLFRSRCSVGDVILERDLFGWYAQCLQCGYRKDAYREAEAVDALKQWRREQEQEVLAKSA